MLQKAHWSYGMFVAKLRAANAVVFTVLGLSVFTSAYGKLLPLALFVSFVGQFIALDICEAFG